MVIWDVLLSSYRRSAPPKAPVTDTPPTARHVALAPYLYTCALRMSFGMAAAQNAVTLRPPSRPYFWQSMYHRHSDSIPLTRAQASSAYLHLSLCHSRCLASSSPASQSAKFTICLNVHRVRIRAVLIHARFRRLFVIQSALHLPQA